MKVLVVGSGGREHALVWKVAQSPKVSKVFACPGNGGMAQEAECVDIKAEDLLGLADFAQKENIGLTLVGPEAPLVAGIVDEFRERGLRVFGPTKAAAQLEGSKVFAKEAMARFGVPAAEFEVFDDVEKARQYVQKKGAPIVIKADGLAAGKGVLVCKTTKEAMDGLDMIMVQKKFGDAGDRVVIEECLFGEEASILAFTDGENVVPLDSSQDHKQIYDGDKGQNTGGMGAYSPCAVVRDDIFEEIINKIMRPVIEGMKKEGKPYKGVLYAGLMMTEEGPKALEFNVRFGDPETQAILPRLKADLVHCLEASIDGKLAELQLEWDPRPCVCVVVASGGYPGSYEKGKSISGLDDAAGLDDVIIFHAGTKLTTSSPPPGQTGLPAGQSVEQRLGVVTNGGRVLGVTALGRDIGSAIKRAYQAVDKVRFENMYCRRDIGQRALKLHNTSLPAGQAGTTKNV